MEGRSKSNGMAVGRSLMEAPTTSLWVNESNSSNGTLLSSSIPSSESPPKNPFRFPPPPLSENIGRTRPGYPTPEHGESDQSFTTGSASDIEDNSDSQSDAAVLGCSRLTDYDSSCRSRSHAICYSGSQSDTGLGGTTGSNSVRMRSSPVPIHQPTHAVRGYDSDESPIGLRAQARYLPPIGVFWDIENCQVPKGRSAVAVAQLIREKFFDGHREAEYLVVCDVKKENSQVIAELNDAQVNLIHVASTCKNAADEKLRQSIRRFAEIYGSPAAIILISGDINFAADLTDLRHRKKIHVILIHNSNTSETLILCANEHYNFSSLVENLPLRGAVKSNNQVVEVIVSNLPADKEHTRIKNRLKKLSDNCGGRVGSIINDRAAVRFPTVEFAFRAQKRMDGEDVFGNKIYVSRPQRVNLRDHESPFKIPSEQDRPRRNTYRSGGEDDKIPVFINKSASQPNNFQNSNQVSSQVMYLSKGFGNSPALDTAQVSVPPLNASQTGIGTATFYRNTPPPRIFGSNLPASQIVNQSVGLSIKNGWPQSNLSSSSVNAGSNKQLVKQPAQADTYAAAYAAAARSRLQDHSLPSYQQRHSWQGPWPVKQTSKLESAKQTSSPLEVASQSLSLLAANLSGPQVLGSSVTEFTSEASHHYTPSDVSRQWDDSLCGQQMLRHSPQKASVAPHVRTPSPRSLGVTAAQPQPPFNHARTRTTAGDGSLWSGYQSNSNGMSGRKSRTPSPYSLGQDHLNLPVGRQSWISGSKTSPFNEAKETDRFFHPINTSGSTPGTRMSNQSQGPVELQVTNLDQNLDAKEMKRVLQIVFREHVMVLHVSVFVQSDGNLAATVKVPSLQDAQYAISQLHRKKVGFKRIQISYAQNGPALNPALVRSQIVSMLQEVPGHRLPLFKFRELFENRYLTSISVSDMYKLRDVCLVSEDPSGRMVTLNPEHRNTPSPLLPSASEDGQSTMELPYCTQHYNKPNTQDKGWAEQELTTLPNARIGLKLFTQQVHSLLQSHNGRLPLPSFVNCYEAQFGLLNVDENGVPLEHLVSCISGVEMYQGVGCVKYLRWATAKDCETTSDIEGSSGVSCVSPPLASQLALFSRELVDLLKTAPNCQLSFNRFIPAYHHHFGRQCRVADYGFTKLIQLLEALPHIVQVLGEGSKRVVTLSHKAQVRRFTSDLLRVLKSQYSKQVTLSEFPTAYQRMLNRPFDVVSYGVCEVEDLLSEVADTTVIVTPIVNSDDVLIAIPKREQTPEEIERTKQFASEVLQLLRYAPQCSMDFSKFIPYYHHHFGRQCRVADYGFTKLIELFEAIPDVVKISEVEEGERKVQLTLQQRLRVLGEQVASSIQASGLPRLSVSVVAENFLHNYGYALRPEDYGLDNMEELMRAIHYSVEVFHTPGGLFVGLKDHDHLHSIGLNVRCILWDRPNCEMSAMEFQEAFSELCGTHCDFDMLLKDLNNVVQISHDVDGTVSSIRLTPLQVFARNVYQLLFELDGKISVISFESSYLQRFGTTVQPAQYGFSSISALLQALPEIVSFRGKGQRRLVVLNTLTGLKSASQDAECLPVNADKWDYTTGGSGAQSPISRNPPRSTADTSKVAESPDTVLKKLIRNLSNQVSPAKQRLYGDRASVGPMGYRPLGFATSQQPLHSSSTNHHFAWGPPHSPQGGVSSFTVPISVPPCPLTSPPPGSPASFMSCVAGAQSASPQSPRSASLPLVQPPHPSELPMPRLALTSPPTQSWNGSTSRDLEVNLQQSVAVEGSKCEAANSGLDSGNGTAVDGNLPGASQDSAQSTNRLKRKQRLAIQFNSPLVPIQ